jgi:hypothetical protein
VVPAIMADLGTSSVRLMTNNPFKVSSLEKLGVVVAQRLPLVAAPTEQNRRYLQTKASRMAHLLPLDASGALADTAAAAEASPPAFFNPATGKTHRWALGEETVVAAINAVKRGELVVVTDDESRENEGDLIMAASLATPETLGEGEAENTHSTDPVPSVAETRVSTAVGPPHPLCNLCAPSPSRVLKPSLARPQVIQHARAQSAPPCLC